MPAVILDRERITELLGELDDLTVSRIQRSGATDADLIEAAALYQGDEEAEVNLSGPSTPASARVLELLREAEVEDDLVDEDDADEEIIPDEYLGD